MHNNRLMAELCIRIGTVFLMAGFLLALPDSFSDELLRLKNTAVAGIVVFGLGKVLFDTFYDEGEL
jgi:hypothetical protein